MEAWMIQVQFEDRSVETCHVKAFRRKLKGTGVKVDMTYTPVRVAPGRFVGRGIATERAMRKILQGRSDVRCFKELRPFTKTGTTGQQQGDDETATE